MQLDVFELLTSTLSVSEAFSLHACLSHVLYMCYMYCTCKRDAFNYSVRLHDLTLTP